MHITSILNGVGLLVGMIGAGWLFWSGRSEGQGLTPYWNQELIDKVEQLAKKRNRHKNGAMSLIILGFILPFVALFF